MQRKNVILIVGSIIIVLTMIVFGLIYLIGINTHNKLVSEQPKQTPLILELTHKVVELKIGDSFNAKKYIKSVKDKNGKDLAEDVKIFEKIETSKPGQFIIKYRIVSEDKQTAIEKELKVIVK